MRPPRLVAASAALLACVVLGGCSGDDPPTKRAEAVASAASSSSTPSPPEPAESEPLSEPTEPALTTPATTAGDLDARSVPGAPEIGRGWKRYVDPGAPEDGYVGNGSWVRSRDAAEVVRSVVPLGCLGLDQAPTLPAPAHALEATYRGPQEAPGVALVLEYKSGAQAAAFLDGMGQIALSCPEPPEKVGANEPLTVVVDPVRVTPTTVLDRRREYGAEATEWLWSEIVVRKGTRVGLLLVATDPSAPPNLESLASRLRAAVPR